MEEVEDKKKKEISEKKQNLIVRILILILIIIDLGSKFIAYKYGKIILPEEGSQDSNLYYRMISIIAIAIMIRFIFSSNTFVKLSTKIILSFGLAGAIGNLVDRFIKGYVINFIKLDEALSINIAYIYITIAWVGIAILLTKNTMSILKDKKEIKAKTSRQIKNRVKE